MLLLIGLIGSILLVACQPVCGSKRGIKLSLKRSSRPSRVLGKAVGTYFFKAVVVVGERGWEDKTRTTSRLPQSGFLQATPIS